jgi:hypothetical protein
MVLGGLILTVGLLAGFAINAAWNAFRKPATQSGAAVTPASPAISTAPARPAARAVRLVYAALGDGVTTAQTAAAADAALRDLVQWVGSDSESEVEALVLTGSFGAPGVDGVATATRLF